MLYRIAVTLLATSIALCASGSFGQGVSAQLSDREAWVGSPIVLQIQISNATKYELPQKIEIDGCDVALAGAPSQSLRTTIFNGRVERSATVLQQYALTPRREGRFEVPELEVQVDGQTQRTPAMTFVARKSDAGDLIFAEIVSKQDKVYVGQSLDLTLKIWIKPYVNRQLQVKLDEGHMWQSLSRKTAWGVFGDRIQELSEERRRPGGETVLRKDTNGDEREYYLYEIDTKIYPTKPGKIDASDVQIIVEYPLALGRQRDPFENFFGGDPFGGSLQELMRGPTRSLSVTSSRPVVADASVGETEVLPIPTANQPADYRGAVGRYRIVTEAEPVRAREGDPITLKIGVIGDGPMELLQAPPLHENQELTTSFQVSDQTLAGFVQGDAKLFATTIRPRDVSVSEIPAIPFTFFDPETESFQTVYSRPIEIEVSESETLSLQAVVSGSETMGSGQNDGQPAFDLTINDSPALAIAEAAPSTTWWWYFAVVPPIVWVLLLLGRFCVYGWRNAGSFRSAYAVAVSELKTASDSDAIVAGMTKYVARQTRADCPTSRHAIGRLRELGHYDAAAKLESHFDQLTKSSCDVTSDQSIRVLQTVHDSLANHGKQVVKRKVSSGKRQLTTGLLPLLFFVPSAECLGADEGPAIQPLVQIIKEANTAYRSGESLASDEPASSRAAFQQAAGRYQTLVDLGIHNSDLFMNLGNAYLQSSDKTNAILNYHRALWMSPGNVSAAKNLRLLESTKDSAVNEAEGFVFSVEQFRTRIGDHAWQVILAISSVAFWLLIATKTILPRLKVLRWAFVMAIPLVLSLFVLNTEPAGELAIITADQIELKSGDGIEFATVAKIDSLSGQRAQVLLQRESWVKVALPSGQEGWLPEKQIQRVRL